MNSLDFSLQSVLKLAWAKKWSWLSLNVIIVSLTVSYAFFIATPYYTSSIVISPREAEGPSSADILSKLGGLGSMVGATLGVGGASNMDKTVLVMQSGDFIGDFIEKYQILPILFPNEWDSTTSQWIETDPEAQPNLLRGIVKFNEDVLVIIKDPTAGVMTISITIQGEGRSKKWVDLFLAETNAYLKQSILTKSARNQKFLRQRMSRTHSPIILEKIQSLLAYEIEKEMLADDLSFDIIESSVVPNKASKPNKVLLLVLAIFLANFIWLLWVIIFPIFNYLKFILNTSDEK